MSCIFVCNLSITIALASSISFASWIDGQLFKLLIKRPTFYSCFTLLDSLEVTLSLLGCTWSCGLTCGVWRRRHICENRREFEKFCLLNFWHWAHLYLFTLPGGGGLLSSQQSGAPLRTYKECRSLLKNSNDPTFNSILHIYDEMDAYM